MVMHRVRLQKMHFTGRVMPTVVGVVGVWLWIAPSSVWSQPPLMLAQDRVPYESATESEFLFEEEAAETIHGVVDSIDTVTLRDGAVFTQLQLKTDREPVRVHLGPKWFIDGQRHRLELDVGRGLEIRGSRNRVGGTPVFVAAEIRNERREERLRLRHPSGAPVWAAGEYLKESK
jgi:hypothetical protein